jgi:hypothetical protein
MTVILLFDTLIFSKRLIKAGMPKEQAEALAEAQKDALHESVNNGLASKKDITDLKHKIDKKSDELKSEMGIMRKEFDGKFNLLYWMMGFVLTFCVAIILKIYF